MTSLSSKELLTGPPLRELILLAGKDSVGKSSAVVSLAWYVEQTSPDATVYVIDTENKLRAALRSFGEDAPGNIQYYKCDDMNAVTNAMEDVLKLHKRGDWLAVESMGRVWERAQDLGYQEVTGMGKSAYMQKRREMSGKKIPVTPTPDQLWSIVKGTHDGGFLDPLTASETLNVLMTTTVAKPPKEGSFIKESADRKILRMELGIDSGIEGAPRLPYYIETLCMLDRRNGVVTCHILRDNLSKLDDSRIEFDIENRKMWAFNFFANCR